MNSGRTLASVLSIILTVLGGSGTADSQTSASPDSALQTILQGLPGTRISLHQAEESAALNATNVRRSEAVYLAAEGSVRREAGAYDPVIFANVNRLDNRQPTSSFFTGAPVLATQQTASTGGVRMSLPIGTKIEAEIPYDPGLYLKAINEGVPVVRSAPTSPPARALARLAAIATGGPEAAATPHDERRGPLGGFRRRG